MSWIHIDDQVAAIEAMVNDSSMQGAYNLTVPEPVTNREFTRILAKALHRPAFLVTPAFVINGIVFFGLQSEETFDRLIRAELENAGAARAAAP